MTRGRKAKRAASGWTTIDGVCCIHNGESRPDTRHRGAMQADAESFIYTCRNCSFKTSWRNGRLLSNRTKDLLSWAGISQEEVRKLDFRVWQLREIKKADPNYQPPEYVKLAFKDSPLPDGAMPITHWLEQPTQDKNFMAVIEYLAGRGEDLLTGFNYYWSPSRENDMHRRLIIPFTWQGRNVGYTARAIFPTRDRYYTNVQSNYIFNSEVVDTDWEYLFIHEGPFDAIAGCGIGMLGDKLTPEQAVWINQSGKIPIVVPDREKQGGNLVDVALKEGWHVTFPKWDSDVKDAADAAKKYGKLYTVWSLIDARTNNRLQINIERQRLR